MNKEILYKALEENEFNCAEKDRLKKENQKLRQENQELKRKIELLTLHREITAGIINN